MDIETYITPERLEKDVEHLQDWMSKEPHMPKVDDKEWIITFLHHNKYSLEKTKKKLENYYAYRNKYPEVLKNRDPLGEFLSRSRKLFNLSLADRLTKDGERILFGSFNPDTTGFDIWEHMKYGFMIVDTFYLEHDRHQYCMSITDCRNLSYAFFLKALPGIKTGIDIFFTAYSDRLKAFHIINAPAGVEKVLNGFKSFLPAKIADRFFVHSSPKELLQVVDENVVCSDFGGKGPRLAEYDEYTVNLMKKHRQWYLGQDDVTTNEDLRRKTPSQIEELKGSFRKLEVD
ncbi:unnamed protein product [Bemisia tabaci]|uniref:CRAL-TRIO domain-containing protein n=1 Tax=Bemisia tabaci TaxID=7038 RepID=A0A9P0AGP4_BEMTA|nr:unnamed protein product [Bemisia tabaci]